jgi:nitroreductase
MSMDVIDAINNRYSCRDFEDKEVPKELLEKIISAALHTPSWQNAQPWDVYVAGYQTSARIIKAVNNPEIRGRAGLEIGRAGGWSNENHVRIRRFMNDIRACCKNQDMRQFSMLNQEMFHAPAMIFLCMEKSLTSWSIFDCGAFSQSVMLAAQEYGLCTISAAVYVSHPEVIRKEMKIPDNKIVLMGIGIGYEKTDNPINKVRTIRKGLDEVVFKD